MDMHKVRVVTRWETRADAVESLSRIHGRQIRAMFDAKKHLSEIRTWLGTQIDLAWLPKDLARKYGRSDKGWTRFLSSIIADAGACYEPGCGF